MHYLWLTMVTASLSLPAVASVEQSLQQCAQISNDTQRLACFDQLSASITSASAQVGVAATAATPAAAAATESAVDRFGAKPKDVVNEPDEIKLTVASIAKSPRGALIITFENGQVWRQAEVERFSLYPGSKVIIKKAALGSFLLQVEGQGRLTRVKREQ